MDGTGTVVVTTAVPVAVTSGVSGVPGALVDTPVGAVVVAVVGLPVVNSPVGADVVTVVAGGVVDAPVVPGVVTVVVAVV